MVSLKNIRHGFDVKKGDVGCTVRKGDKWSKVRRGILMHLFNCGEAHSGLCSCEHNCTFEGRGIVIGSWVGELSKLPPSLLAMEHNESARDMSVLRQMLVAGYGEIKDTDTVTALIYVRDCC